MVSQTNFKMSPDKASTNRQLVLRVRSGDESAFTEIVKQYGNELHGSALRILRNRTEAEDIVQDSFVRAHRSFHLLKNDAALSSWLHAITINLAKNRYWHLFRRHYKDTISLDMPLYEGSSESIVDRIPCNNESITNQIEVNELVTVNAECMEDLNDSHREILILRNVQSLSYKEISEILGINIGTVKSRIVRARDKLRELVALRS